MRVDGTSIGIKQEKGREKKKKKGGGGGGGEKKEDESGWPVALVYLMCVRRHRQREKTWHKGANCCKRGER